MPGDIHIHTSEFVHTSCSYTHCAHSKTIKRKNGPVDGYFKKLKGGQEAGRVRERWVDLEGISKRGWVNVVNIHCMHASKSFKTKKSMVILNCEKKMENV